MALNRDLVAKTEAFLKEKFDSSDYFAAHPKEKDYRLTHSYRVANIGRKIAENEGFDETAMVIACLLHDVSYCEAFGESGWQEHGRRAAQIARPFLEGLGLDEEQVRNICYGIAIHVDDEADFEGIKTPFALSVGDADNIDRFDAYRIHETLFYDGFIEKDIDEKLALVEKRLARLQELRQMRQGSKTADALWQERLSFYLSFYERLQAQLQSSREILAP